MAIVKLKKITLCGLSREKQAVLEDLQVLGAVHLIATQHPVDDLEYQEPEAGQGAYPALRYLLASGTIRHQVKFFENFDIDHVVCQVNEVKAAIRTLSDQRDFLRKRIKEIQPWGDFALPDEGQLGNLKLWFYIVPNRQMKKIPVADLVWKVVHKDNLNCYVVVISDTEPKPEQMPVARTHTGKTPLSELNKLLNEVELQLEDALAEKESLTRWIGLISLHLAETEDREFLNRALSGTLDLHGVFVIQAWVPDTLLCEIDEFAYRRQLMMLSQDPEPGDTPPTLLNNSPTLAGGQDVVSFYQTPNYYDWDPSGVVFFSFSLFFAMILSDAGYAALFGLLLIFKWRPLSQSIKGRRFRTLAASTVIMAILWGLLVGSYFGYGPPQNGIAAWFKVLDIQNFSVMMHISVAIGVAHLIFANLIMAWRQRHNVKAIVPLAWIIFAAGGYVMWLSMSSDSSQLRQTAEVMMGGAVLFILLFSSEREIKRPIDFLKRMLDGLIRLTGISKLFGDVLSYMRLFALGLASASLAMTFNQLAEHAMRDEYGLGILFGLLILMIGHSLNILLCIMSGVVHGLRLNFIEFYNWSVSDEGYPFKAFAKKELGNE